MKIEKTCSPGHCLGMLNDNMRTDILRAVHDGVWSRMDDQNTKSSKKSYGTSRRKSPLEMLIESIEDVLTAYDGGNLFTAVGPNPFNVDPRYRFQPEPDFHHDVALLKSQLGSLHEILASLEW